MGLDWWAKTMVLGALAFIFGGMILMGIITYIVIKVSDWREETRAAASDTADGAMREPVNGDRGSDREVARAQRDRVWKKAVELKRLAKKLFGRGVRVTFDIPRGDQRLNAVSIRWAGERLDDKELLDEALGRFYMELPGLGRRWAWVVDPLTRTVHFVRSAPPTARASSTVAGSIRH